MPEYYHSAIFVEKFYILKLFSYNDCFKIRRYMKDGPENDPVEYILESFYQNKT